MKYDTTAALYGIFFFLISFFCASGLHAQVNFGGGSGLKLPSADGRSLVNIAKEVESFRTSMLQKINASADSYEYIGDNMIARGHAVIKFGDLTVTADNAVVNLTSQDIEASGNVTLAKLSKEIRIIDFIEYEDYLNDPVYRVTVIDRVATPTGRQKLKVQIESITSYVKAERLAGNLSTGMVQFSNFAIKTGALNIASKHAERTPDGSIHAEGAKMTTCEYVMDNHEHYALTASSVEMHPRKYNSGLSNYTVKHQEHEILALNSMLKFWNVPVFWMPALYKPYETDSFGVDFEVGASSDWGFFVRLSKPFTLIDTKKMHANAAALFDYYQERGFGGGIRSSILTDNSRTEIFGYGLYDRNPYYVWEDKSRSTEKWYKQNSRLTIPTGRYDIKISNVTHITPRLDFRGQFELLSDYNFLYDYYYTRYKENIQPPTYAALEYMHDRFSAAVYTTPKVNYFDTVVQRLPEGYFNMPRQELFGGLYYQSETSAAYLEMKWREYDKDSRYQDLFNYHSGRFDTLHMFYYPIRTDFINIIPRAGIRLTGYTNSSDKKISDEELQNIFDYNADMMKRDYSVKDYDNNGGANLRFLAEFGVEVNTKIYRTWQDVRSSFANLDGLRHVMIPYANYTYLPDTYDKRYNYYFDDIDRIEKQHFIRMGLLNRLQTREGDYQSERIREWFSFNTFWDYHVESQNGFNHIGDLGMQFSFSPHNDLTLTSELLWDIGQNNDHDTEAQRGDRTGGRPGLSQIKYLSEWNSRLTYKIAKDWLLYASYIYSDSYKSRGLYSMGSMFERVTATSSLTNYSNNREQTLKLGLKFPTYIDPRLKAGMEISYDVETALLSDANVSVTRDFHCWKAGLQLGTGASRASDGGKEYSNYISFFVGLSAMPSTTVGFTQSHKTD